MRCCTRLKLRSFLLLAGIAVENHRSDFLGSLSKFPIVYRQWTKLDCVCSLFRSVISWSNPDSFKCLTPASSGKYSQPTSASLQMELTLNISSISILLGLRYYFLGWNLNGLLKIGNLQILTSMKWWESTGIRIFKSIRIKCLINIYARRINHMWIT